MSFSNSGPLFQGQSGALTRCPSVHHRKSIQGPPSCQSLPFAKFRDYWAGFFQSLWKQLPIEVHDVFKLQGAQLMSQSLESNQIHILVAQSCQGFASAAAPELIRIVQSCNDRIKMDQVMSSSSPRRSCFEPLQWEPWNHQIHGTSKWASAAGFQLPASLRIPIQP